MTAAADRPLVIDVVSDVVCPWCYLGKRRLERALTAFKRPVAITWRPFQLDATIPRGGIPRDAYLTRKFGSLDAVDGAHRRLAEMGRAEGIDYRFAAITRSPNTLDAHRLIRWAAAEGRQDALVERLFRAYFTDGLDIGDPQVLARLAAEVGVGGGGDVAARLASDEDRQAVAAEIALAQQIGVTGVPCFILDQRFAVVGAQSPETLAEAMAAGRPLRTAPPPSDA